MNRAASSTVLNRPKACLDSNSARRSASLNSSAVILVSSNPGSTQLDLTFRAPYSSAIDFVSPINPAFAAGNGATAHS